MGVFNEFKKVFIACKKEFIIRFVYAVLVRGSLLIIPILLSYIISSISNGDYSRAIKLTIISIIVTVLYRLFESFGGRAYYNLYNKIYSYYNFMAVDKTVQNSIFSLSRFSLGQYSNMLISDVDIMATFFAGLVIRFVQFLEFIVIFVYFFTIDKIVFISLVIVSMILLFIIGKMNINLAKLNGIKKQKQDSQVSKVYEYFLSIKEIKSFNLFNKISPKSKEGTKEFLRASAKYNNRNNYNNNEVLLILEASRLLSVLYSIHKVSIGDLGLEMVLIIYNYYQKVIDNFSTILAISGEYANYKISFERYSHLLEYSIPKKKFNYSVKSSAFSGEIEFKDVLYGYRHDPILNGATFTIRANELTAITGRDSSGKNGISNLLLKFNRKHEGNIIIDGISIEDIPDEDYFKMISLVRESAIFFDSSIKDNLCIIENDFEKVQEMCKKLGIHDRIMALKDGYDTVIDENIEISTSTRQMIGIVRMLLKDSKIMIFDEALGTLDEKDEALMIDVLKELKQNHTIIVVSHDKDVIRASDNVIVFDNHAVVENGTINELIERKGKYYELFEE